MSSRDSLDETFEMAWRQFEKAQRLHSGSEIKEYEKQRAKQMFHQWALDEVKKEFEAFRVFCYEKHAFESFDTPASNRQGWLDTKLRDYAERKLKGDIDEPNA